MDERLMQIRETEVDEASTWRHSEANVTATPAETI